MTTDGQTINQNDKNPTVDLTLKEDDEQSTLTTFKDEIDNEFDDETPGELPPKKRRSFFKDRSRRLEAVQSLKDITHQIIRTPAIGIEVNPKDRIYSNNTSSTINSILNDTDFDSFKRKITELENKDYDTYHISDMDSSGGSYSSAHPVEEVGLLPQSSYNRQTSALSAQSHQSTLTLTNERASIPVRHRKCTDPFCFVALLFTWVFGIGIGVYAVQNGDPRLILHPAE